MLRRCAVVGVTFLSLSYAGFALAVDVSSPSYQNKDSTFAPATFNADSPSFQINGSLDSIVGSGSSPSFTIQSGVPLNDPAACGDGIVQGGEACDAGGSNGACPQTCSSSCTLNSCGGGGGSGGGGLSSGSGTGT